MGRGRLARHGKGPAAIAQLAFGLPPAGVRDGLSAGRAMQCVPLPSRRLASAVLPGRTSGAPGAVRTDARKRVGSLAEDEARKLGAARARDRLPLEAVSLPGCPDDGDESGV